MSRTPLASNTRASSLVPSASESSFFAGRPKVSPGARKAAASDSGSWMRAWARAALGLGESRHELGSRRRADADARVGQGPRGPRPALALERLGQGNGQAERADEGARAGILAEFEEKVAHGRVSVSKRPSR